MRRKARRGMVLIIVMIVVLLAALAAYSYTHNMVSSARIAKLAEDHVQARLTAWSGIEWNLATLEQTAAQRASLVATGTRDAVSPQPLDRDDDRPGRSTLSGWAFAVVSPSTSSVDRPEANWRHGLENESAKLHIPTLLAWERTFPGHARLALRNLPGASDSVIDGWLADHGGVSNPQSEPQRWMWNWSGGDWNENYRLDPLEELLLQHRRMESGREPGEAGPQQVQSSSATSDLDGAWRKYLTWENGERNESWEGQPRVHLNQTDLSVLHQQLMAIWPADWANFVIAYRQFGPTAKRTSSPLSANEWTPTFDRPARIVLQNPLELVGVAVDVPQSDGKTKQIESPFSDSSTRYRDYLSKLIDEVTETPQPFLVGRVDILSARREVLLGVPGMDVGLADRIIASRETTSNSSDDRRTAAWLLMEGLVDLPKMRQILPWVSCRSDVYRGQFIGFRDATSPVYRCTVILDGRQRPARAIRCQEWHAADRGFDTYELQADTRRPRS